MTLTAGDVREKQFSATGLARRGYHDAEVDEFLDEVILALEERDRLIERLRQPDDASAGAATTQPAPSPTPADATAAAEVLALAQRTAQDLLDQASQDAEILVADARMQAEEILRAAGQQREEVTAQLAESRKELDMISDALSRAGDEARQRLEAYLEEVLLRVRPPGSQEQVTPIRMLR